MTEENKKTRAEPKLLKGRLLGALEDNGIPGLEASIQRRGLADCRAPLRAIIADAPEGDDKVALVDLYSRLYPRQNAGPAVGRAKDVIKVSRGGTAVVTLSSLGLKHGAAVRKVLVDVPNVPGGKGILVTPA